MADGNFRLNASANFGRLENEVERQRRTIRRLEGEVQRLAGGFKTAGSTHQRSFGAMISQAKILVGTYIGVHQAIALVNQAIRESIELQNRARQTTQTVAGAKREVIPLTGQFDDEQRARLFRQATEIGLRFGIGQAESISAIAAPLSATSGETEGRIAKTLDTFEEFAPLFIGRMEEAGGIMAATLDAQRTLGVDSGKVTNFLLGALSQSRLEGIEDLPNLIRALAASQAVTAAPDPVLAAKQVAAMFGAFQAISGEAKGAITSTAITNFLSVMTEVAGERGISPEDLLNKIRADEVLALEVAEKVRGRSFAKPIQREFLQDGKLIEVYKEQLQALQNINEDSLRQLQEFSKGGDRDLLLDTQERIQRAKSEQLLKDQRGVEGSVRERLFGEFGVIRSTGRGLGSAVERIRSRQEFEARKAAGFDEFGIARRQLTRRIQEEDENFFLSRGRELFEGTPLSPFGKGSLLRKAFGGRLGEEGALALESTNPNVIALQEELRSIGTLQGVIQKMADNSEKTEQRHREVLDRLDKSAALRSTIATGVKQEN